ncbi:unnamed protein product [Pseudo-nitzschia multistriata]|uniref:JmjC domain-containing protein n=1 Tax=Pseudo-nitzschia multistriata TaxID=183589 RepID=A0A448Z1B3_9STRA|nr:unnamed protein product [Pseudo-nitzschia multistriata]
MLQHFCGFSFLPNLSARNETKQKQKSPTAAAMGEDRITRDVLLSPDERYDVWEIKRVERPHLMDFENEEEEDDAETDAGADNGEPLPLVDGCDLRGWRRSGLVDVSPCTRAALRVGQGCTLMRRESQLPVLSSRSLSRWNELRARLLAPPPPCREPARIGAREAVALPHHPWFERENLPVVLEGLTETWRATETCTLSSLVEAFGETQWRFSDTHGATMALSSYQKYVGSLEGLTDDAPLAVYDSQLEGDGRASLLGDYSVPGCFAAPDLFRAMAGDEIKGDDDDDVDDDSEDDSDDDENENENRPELPPYRWILIGPARSGTGLHIDPLGTHAWVTLLEGAKRWVLFPYGTDPSSIGMGDPQVPSAVWFSGGWYERALEAHPGAVEVLQLPGETVYVPAGWPHLVLNLDLSTAITHNYATEFPSLERILGAAEREEPGLVSAWRDWLRKERPSFCEKAGASFGSSARREGSLAPPSDAE